jgi:hydrogenase 3 maturation protease
MLQALLNKNDTKSILFVGVGNVLKRDDGIGVYISQHIQTSPTIHSLPVEVSIENYIGKINSLKPDILILIDSMNFQEKPGYWDILPIDRVNGFTTNTHNITLNKVSELFDCPQIFILGIQPLSVNFGEEICHEVKKTADLIIKRINKQNAEII